MDRAAFDHGLDVWRSCTEPVGACPTRGASMTLLTNPAPDLATTPYQPASLPNGNTEVSGAGTSPWANEQLTNRVAQLWLDKSALQIARIIAEEFGVAISRNAIISKITRMGLAGVAKSVRHPCDRSKPRLASTNPTPRASSEPKPSVLRCVAEPPLNLTLLELPANGCHFIAGDDYLYCGHTVHAGTSYCFAHFQLTHKDTQPTSGTRPFYRERGFRR